MQLFGTHLHGVREDEETCKFAPATLNESAVHVYDFDL